MKMFNGHRSWNAWNVAYWIGHDWSLNRYARCCLKRAGGNPAQAARLFRVWVGWPRTPDGARYNQWAVSLALAGLIE